MESILLLVEQIEQIMFWDWLMANDNHRDFHEHFGHLQLYYTNVQRKECLEEGRKRSIVTMAKH